MPRPKNIEPSVRIRFEGYQRKPIDDPRVQKAVDWYLENRENRKAFPIMWELIIAALNGELGESVKVAVEQGNTDDAINALQDLMGAFAG
jgi:hypothetical protein